MKITTTTNRTSVAIQYGFIGFKLDFNQMETSVKTIKTIITSLVDIHEKEEENLLIKTKQILKFIRIANESIKIESEVEDWETVMEIDIDDQTLIGKAKFLKLPVQDENMTITIDYMKISNLIKELSTFDINPE